MGITFVGRKRGGFVERAMSGQWWPPIFGERRSEVRWRDLLALLVMGAGMLAWGVVVYLVGG